MSGSPVVMVMGVSGSGKSTVGVLLAAALNAKFVDADDYHPDANRQKMASGIPLTDAERLPWLQILNERLKEWQLDGQSIVLACSALRESYRTILRCEMRPFIIVYLRGTEALIQERSDHRSGHFMPSTLVKSQFATLEEPADAIVVDVCLTPAEMVSKILADCEFQSAIC